MCLKFNSIARATNVHYYRCVIESVRCQYMVNFNPVMHHSAGYDRFAFNISTFTRGLAHFNFNRTFCTQTVGILIRRCVLWSDLDLQCSHVSHKKDVTVILNFIIIFLKYTVNSEIFATVYFRETSMRSFVKINPSRNDEITLSFTDAGISDPSREILKSQICILTLFAKRSGFTVYS